MFFLKRMFTNKKEKQADKAEVKRQAVLKKADRLLLKLESLEEILILRKVTSKHV